MRVEGLLDAPLSPEVGPGRLRQLLSERNRKHPISRGMTPQWNGTPASRQFSRERSPASQFGNANTHSTEPPSGFWISGVSVASALEWLDPLPTATATYCLPFTL